ncbi:glycosyl transferase [Candidatus Epulonipiscium fishelsonii]|uniref:Glycosyl transferase n=1 Tax=Candidatus Epulonipiscium fishelsonii TaxID=77094 RepID=A0ACC8X7J6_9FIRM|nr:glycosyl transferase [Epulopiscium sp. SCG-B11WGA-EpuloA1]ONI40731.1 glycosyl transferase [Epulopiscium sp. SCG-B05WGA-EpuloA1]
MNIKIIKKLKRLILNPYEIFGYLGRRELLNWIPDKLYLMLRCKAKLGYFPNLNNPKTFNEKLQWLKLHDRNPRYTKLVDKYEVRKYIAKKIGKEYLIPLLGVWDNFDEIDFDKLPNQFVLKATHDSGGVFICKDKNNFNKEDARKKINKSLKRNYYWGEREWPYKNVKPKIICEKYMVDESGYELKDYKIFCFNGKPKLIQVNYGRFTNHKRNYYNLKWQHLDLEINSPTDKNVIIQKPKNFDKMIQLARILSKDFAHVRIDFYSIKDKLYFGEITLYHGSGYEEIRPFKYDKLMGSWINL